MCVESISQNNYFVDSDCDFKDHRYTRVQCLSGERFAKPNSQPSRVWTHLSLRNGFETTWSRKCSQNSRKDSQKLSANISKENLGLQNL